MNQEYATRSLLIAHCPGTFTPNIDTTRQTVNTRME
jgi:hypothetical protein